MKLKVIKAELLRHFECYYCEQPLNEDNIQLSKTGMIECQNTVGQFNTPCLRKNSLTYCEGCGKLGITPHMRFARRKLVGMKAEVRCHVCDNGKLSAKLQRAIPHTKQVFFDGNGKVIIKPPDVKKDVISELKTLWEKDSKFTVDMIGQGEFDTSHLTVISKEFWTSDIPFMGYDEPLLQPYCDRCSKELMPLPDNSKVTDYSYVCPKCGVHFNVIDAGGQESNSNENRSDKDD